MNARHVHESEKSELYVGSHTNSFSRGNPHAGEGFVETEIGISHEITQRRRGTPRPLGQPLARAPSTTATQPNTRGRDVGRTPDH